MLAAQRQAWILDEIRRQGAVRVTDLVAALGVSDMTVRRDLDALAEQGLVAKVHGGATTRGGGSTDEPAFS
jgi:DeoR/GlpR family transcriptional regulator of sugar metabolism